MTQNNNQVSYVWKCMKCNIMTSSASTIDTNNGTFPPNPKCPKCKRLMIPTSQETVKREQIEVINFKDTVTLKY